MTSKKGGVLKLDVEKIDAYRHEFPSYNRLNMDRGSMTATVGPIVTHCSAGIGRTGTVIALDMLMDRIRWFGLDTDISFFHTLRDIRKSRKDMVQSQVQYDFIAKALMEFVKMEKERIYTVWQI